MNTYVEEEIKVLDVNVNKLQKILKKLGAKKVFVGGTEEIYAKYRLDYFKVFNT